MDRFNCLNVLNVDVEGQLLRYMTWQHLYAWNIYFGIADLLKCQSTRKDCEWVFFALIWFLSYLWKVSLLNVAKGWRSLAEGRYGSLASLFLKPLKAGQALYLQLMILCLWTDTQEECKTPSCCSEVRRKGIPLTQWGSEKDSPCS